MYDTTEMYSVNLSRDSLAVLNGMALCTYHARPMFLNLLYSLFTYGEDACNTSQKCCDWKSGDSLEFVCNHYPN